MKKCPDEDTLKQLIEGSLTEEITSDILSHLSLCNRCKDAVRCHLEEESALLQSLSTGPHVHDEQALRTQKCLSRSGLLAYLLECLTEEQNRIVEVHLNECDRCLRTLIALGTTVGPHRM